MLKAIYGTLAAVGVCAVLAFGLRHNPVLISLRNDVRRDQGFQILNPFRSRQPELPAIRLLERLKAGDCAAALSAVDQDRDRVTLICGKEGTYPIGSWRLDAIGRDRERILLRYRVRRTFGGKRVNDPFWIWVSKRADTSWEVTGYEPWY